MHKHIDAKDCSPEMATYALLLKALAERAEPEQAQSVMLIVDMKTGLTLHGGTAALSVRVLALEKYLAELKTQMQEKN